MTTPRHEVAILGGGLAGLTLALQLKRSREETTVVVIEKRAGPAPDAAFKVGESTGDVGAQYFREVVGAADHLDNVHLRKVGLRFFFPRGTTPTSRNASSSPRPDTLSCTRIRSIAGGSRTS